MPALGTDSCLLMAIGTLVLAGMPPARGNLVLDWTAEMMAAIRSENTGPTISTRNLAILNVATYEAVNAIVQTHQPYAFHLQTPAETSVEAAVIGAGREVMLVLYPSFRGRTEDLYQVQIAALPDTPSVRTGLALGHEAAVRMIALRAADGSATDIPYIPSAKPGQWQRTPPFYRPPFTPQWRYVDTFCLPSLTPFLPSPPPRLDSPEYARDFEEVKELGARNSVARTAEQSLIAEYWSDFSYTAMPPGHWHEIASTIARDRRTPLAETARLFALLGLAQADAAIVCWEAKYAWNLWRPVTAIRRADEDGNAATVADPEWDSLLAAPPFPSYTSGHSTFSKAAAEVLSGFYGTDAITFTTRSDSVPGVFRVYQSLAACADEVGMSRIYGGIHFQFDNTQGKRTGAGVAHHILANYLLPHASLPRIQILSRSSQGPRLRVHAEIGHSFVVEASQDLQRWESVAEGVAIPGGAEVRDPAATDRAARFYRVRN